MKALKQILPIMFAMYGLELTNQLKSVAGKNASPEDLATAIYKAGFKMKVVMGYFMGKINQMPPMIQELIAEEVLEQTFVMLGKEAVMNHKCDNPDCGVEKIKALLYPEHGHIVIENPNDQEQFDKILAILNGEEITQTEEEPVKEESNGKD